eukprot:2332038-Amphidinium_carterae.1
MLDKVCRKPSTCSFRHATSEALARRSHNTLSTFACMEETFACKSCSRLSASKRLFSSMLSRCSKSALSLEILGLEARSALERIVKKNTTASKPASSCGESTSLLELLSLHFGLFSLHCDAEVRLSHLLSYHPWRRAWIWCMLLKPASREII